MKKNEQLFTELIELIRMLRSPGGCPWDIKQTSRSVKSYLVEELYELLEAIDAGDSKMLTEETGDILFMLLFLVNIYEQEGIFYLNEAMQTVIDKMKHRHPHVFGTTRVDSAEEVVQNWQKLKEQEGKKAKKSQLDGIPENLPALSSAFFLGVKASKVGFDWKSAGEVIKKVTEETEELKQALRKDNQRQAADEIGDMLFSVVNLSRHLDIDPEQALMKTNRKFKTRFKYIESELKKKGADIKTTGLEEMDKLWKKAKKKQ